jgi:Flp pilus assembly protein protease CpaA
VTLTVGIVVTLVLLLVVATVTDVRDQIIYNWNTYPGILLGFGLRWFDGGAAGIEDSFKGFLVCGFLMLVCFVLFQLGGGDLKLIAMMGAFLGFERGVEALLWTLVLGGILGSVVVVWQLGFLNIVTGTVRHIVQMWRARGWVPLDAEARQPLKQTLFLAPAGLVAVLIVTYDIWRQGLLL